MSQMILDRTGFPMIRVEPLNGYIHLLPVTKIQFEYYLWNVPQSGFDQKWYDEVCRNEIAGSRRISPQDIDANNYWHIFIGSLFPPEAGRFADWQTTLGQGRYRLPEESEWLTAYNHFKAISAGGEPLLRQALALEGLSARCRTILERLEAAPRGAGQAAPGGERQLFFLGGMMEWVSVPQRGYGLYGRPNAAFGAYGEHPENRRVFMPNNPQLRDPARGFRLLKIP